MTGGDRVRRAGAALLACLILVGALLVAGCTPAPTPRPSLGPVATASIEAPASGSPAPVTSPVTGVLLSVDAQGLAEVKGFTLRTDGGREVAFVIGTLENPVDFPPGHLAEHLATSSQVRVFFRADGDRLVVYRLEDAEAG
jgi:hypothetical protein